MRAATASIRPPARTVTIPMRGNELDDQVPRPPVPVLVTIPMRGNKLRITAEGNGTANGYDPHEG